MHFSDIEAIHKDCHQRISLASSEKSGEKKDSDDDEESLMVSTKIVTPNSLQAFSNAASQQCSAYYKQSDSQNKDIFVIPAVV